jgi:hypothetical protein
MNKTSTRDLIKYAYNETRLNETVETRNAIDGDPLIEGEYKELLESMGTLDEIQMNPSDETIKAILKKAKHVKR